MRGYIGYRSALCLTLALAAVNGCFLLYAAYIRSSLTGSLAIYAGIALTLAFGLWVQSKIARYLGALLCWVSAAAVAWPIVSGNKPVLSIGLVWVISLGLLSVAIGYVLLFSKTFATEFSYERANQPRYKALLRNGVLVVLGIAAMIATAIDIVHLASM
jgi:hypothetical protein